MRFSTFEEAEERPAFSNGTEWDIWSSQWCHKCKNDINEDCPLILTGFMGKTPPEWKCQDNWIVSCDKFEEL